MAVADLTVLERHLLQVWCIGMVYNCMGALQDQVNRRFCMEGSSRNVQLGTLGITG